MFARETYCFQREHVCAILRKVAVKLIAERVGEAPTCLSQKLFTVKGMEVGFSTDSKLPAHFDIAALVRPGSNHLAVRVYRWDTSSYLEKQDYWHLSGIQRSVRLVAKPAVHLRDWAHKVRFDAWIAPSP